MGERDCEIITVGVASKKEAENLGFIDVTSAAGEKGGDVGILLDYVQANFPKDGGRFLHLAGESISKNLKNMLCEEGYEAERINLYEAEKLEEISSDTQKLLAEGKVDSVVFYSARAATSFIKAINNNKLNQSVKSVNAVCLSHRISDSLPQNLFKEILVTKEMDNDSLVPLLKEI